ncbi:MAG TPA: VOC family protein [Acidimicrobiales bacterium]|nr:VOC family protein [Acidimicrobiales bacterium]
MPDRPVIDQFNVVSADVEASVAFYRLLGVDIEDTDPEWAARHRSGTTEGADLDIDSEEFARQWDPGWRGGMGVLGFKVPTREAVDERYATLTGARYRSQAAPHDAFWGARYAIVEDPDGNAVGIMSPVDPDLRSAPPT